MMKIVSSIGPLAGVRAYGGRQGVPASDVAVICDIQKFKIDQKKENKDET